jgi:hypothetical protein
MSQASENFDIPPNASMDEKIDWYGQEAGSY